MKNLDTTPSMHAPLLARSLAARPGLTSMARDELRRRDMQAGSGFVQIMGSHVFFHGKGTRAAIDNQLTAVHPVLRDSASHCASRSAAAQQAQQPPKELADHHDQFPQIHQLFPARHARKGFNHQSQVGRV